MSTQENHLLNTLATKAQVLGLGIVLPSVEPALLDLPESLGEPCLAYACDSAPGKGMLSPKTLRRLGRAQRLALTAGHLALEDSGLSNDLRKDVAICVGTGMGELGHTYAFLENMITLDEMHPKPASFTNSVHNALATQMAIAFSCKGENHTFIHSSISFESALWQGMILLNQGRARHVLVCGADELNGYSVAAERAFGRWQSKGGPLAPLCDEESATSGTLPGEGAASLLLGLANEARDRSVRIQYVTSRPVFFDVIDTDIGNIETMFIDKALAKAGVQTQDVDLVVCGANGDAVLDSRYRKVMEAFSLASGHAVTWGTYKQRTGDFHTAHAIGISLAVDSVRRGSVLPEITLTPSGFDRALNTILVYNLCSRGFHSVCVVTG